MKIKIYYTMACIQPHPQKLNNETSKYIYCEDVYTFPDVIAYKLTEEQKNSWIKHIRQMHYNEPDMWINKVDFIDTYTLAMER